MLFSYYQDHMHITHYIPREIIHFPTISLRLSSSSDLMTSISLALVNAESLIIKAKDCSLLRFTISEWVGWARVGNQTLGVFGFRMCLQRFTLSWANVVKHSQTQVLWLTIPSSFQTPRWNLYLCKKVHLARFDLIESSMWGEAKRPIWTCRKHPMDSLRCVQN